MTIEFRKVKKEQSEFCLEFNEDSTIIEAKGVFFYCSAKGMIELDLALNGSIGLDCCRCGEDFNSQVKLKSTILICDGVVKNSQSDENCDISIYEALNHKVEFRSIIQSEIDSYKLDYHKCNDCKANQTSSQLLEVEY